MIGRRYSRILAGIILSSSLIASSFTAVLLAGFYSRVQYQTIGKICEEMIEAEPDIEQDVIAALTELSLSPAIMGLHKNDRRGAAFVEILRCEKLCKVYGTGNSQVTALNQVDVTVEKGEFVAIVGASGSGKSTLLHMIGGVDSPSSGKVLVDGTDLSSLNPAQSAIFRRRKVGIVYQFYNLIPTLTVRQMRVPKQQATRLIDALEIHQFVERVSNETDRRVVELCLTPMAATYLDQYYKKNKVFLQSLEEQLSEKELEDLNQAVVTLSEILSKLR